MVRLSFRASTGASAILEQEVVNMSSKGGGEGRGGEGRGRGGEGRGGEILYSIGPTIFPRVKVIGEQQ